METTIFAQIRKELTDFYTTSIEAPAGNAFNQNDTIKLINLYLASKYEDQSTYLGREKLFYNVVIPPCEVAMRMLNLDTKQIKLWPLNPKSEFATKLLEKELKLWLKQHTLGQVLNQIAEEAPRYGSVVLEKTPDGAKLIDLRRLVLDPSVERIQQSRFITTIHYMTPSELRETGWDNVDVAIDRFGENNTAQAYEDKSSSLNVVNSSPYIKVHKRYGEVPAWWIDQGLKPGTKSGDKMVKAVEIVAGAESQLLNADGKSVGEQGVILFSSRWHKKWPFKDFHYTKVKGRWLGLGIVEMLFDVQQRINELKNQKRISMEISAMHLFQTKDRGITRNIVTDQQSGDILVVKSEITPIANEERNLPAFDSEEASYLGQADRLTFAYEAIRGQQPDAAVTLGQTQIATAQATSVYAFKKENLGLFLQDFFNDLVLPQLMNDLTPQHIMRFTGSIEELVKLDQAAADVYANDKVMEHILAGNMPTPEDQQAIKDKAMESYRKQGEQRFIKIKDAFYDDAEFEFDFLITGEQDNPAEIVKNLQGVLSSYNPQFMQDPFYKLIFTKFADKLGVSQNEIDLADQQHSQMPQQPTEQPQPVQ